MKSSRIKPNDKVISVFDPQREPMIVFEVTGGFAHCWKQGWDENRPKPFGLNTLELWEPEISKP